jgi:AcrR family transcriptional regulator
MSPRPSSEPATVEEPLPPAAARAVRRALAAKELAYTEEVHRLLDAGLALMVEGDVSPRVADIVARAGLSNQAFYRHFAGKEDLIVAVVEAGSQRLDAYLRRRVERFSDPEEQLDAWIRGVASQGRPPVAAPTRAAMASYSMLPPERRQTTVARPGLGVLHDVLERLGSRDPERDTATIAVVAFGRLEQFLWNAPMTDADADHLVGFCRAAVRR